MSYEAMLNELLSRPSVTESEIIALFESQRNLIASEIAGSQGVIFFSGDIGSHGLHSAAAAEALAEAARANGVNIVTINSTSAGRLLADPDFADLINRAGLNASSLIGANGSLWADASRTLAENGSGRAIFIGPEAASGRIFSDVEWPAILNNSDFDSIAGIPRSEWLERAADLRAGGMTAGQVNGALFDDVKAMSGAQWLANGEIEFASRGTPAGSAYELFDARHFSEFFQQNDLHVGDTVDLAHADWRSIHTLAGEYGDDLIQAIGRSANWIKGAAPYLGVVGDVLEGSLAAINAYERFQQGDNAGAITELGGFAGSLAGGAAGALFAGAVFSGPIGLAMAVAFAIGGGYGGEQFGRWATDNLIDLFSGIGSLLNEVGDSFSGAIQTLLRRLMDPIVVDLDGDGIELVARANSTVHFDMDGDGRQEWTGWVGSDDGFLAIDENGNGRIDSITELIGDQGRSGFTELATHDSNGDHNINASDTIWSSLRVWRDANGNGITDAGELLTMAQAGIRSIDLRYTNPNFPVEGNRIHETSTFERTDGTFGTIVDAWLDVDNVNTAQDAATTGNGTIDALPNIRGYGDVAALRQAMLADGALATLVTTIVNLRLDQLGSIRTQIEQILYRWSGTTGIAVDSRGPNFDGRKLATLEKFLGTAFALNGVTDPNAQSAPLLQQAWQDLVDGVMTRLLLSGPLASVLPDTAYVAEADRTLSLSTTTTLMETLVAAMPAGDGIAQARYLSMAVGVARQIAHDQGTDTQTTQFRTTVGESLRQFGLEEFVNDLDKGIALLSIPASGVATADGLYRLGNASNTLYLSGNHQGIFGEGGNDKIVALDSYNALFLDGGAGNDTLIGGSDADWLDGGAGDDRMAGGQGNDTYVVDSIGDIVSESTYGGEDTVRSSITYTLGRSIENLVLTGTAAINGTGNELSNDLTGNSAANVLTGLDGDDRLDGGAGADTLRGGAGNDTYVVDDAADVIIDEAGYSDTVEASVNWRLGSGIEHLTLIGTDNLRATGNSGNNTIRGNAGNNVLNGLGGSDYLLGGLGNDVYIVDGSDSVYENANEGTDTVQSSADFYLGSNIENLTLTGDLDIDGYGNDLANVLIGNSGVNRLDGRQGADRMAGAGGDDTYVVDNSRDRVIEVAGGGIDTVEITLASYTLGSEVENLRLEYYSDTTTVRRGTGNALSNIIVGSQYADILSGAAGNDTIDGANGADRLIGGIGDDVYVVNSTDDVVVERVSEGSDTVRAYQISYTLAANLENLELTGYGSYNGTGNALRNRLTGNDYDNVLNGLGGADTMSGGYGNDTYVVDNIADTIIEDPGQGDDTVVSSITVTLGQNVENLTLSGAAAINGTGNDLSNDLTGNSAANVLTGLDGDDRLDGSAGADTLRGGAGNDTYVVDRATDVVQEDGNDWNDQIVSSVSYVVPDRVERITLTGTANINATGNRLDNTLTGNVGNNVLNGGGGADDMYGGLGDDTYIVDSTSDYVSESSNAGIDTVRSYVDYQLYSNIENLILIGSDDTSATGNDTANTINGNSGSNVIDGRLGADTMAGGGGDDTYYMDNAGDIVSEQADAGMDTIRTSLANTTLGANVENLVLWTGYMDSVIRNGIGNSLDNEITGNNAANNIDGAAGNDRLFGEAGNDTLIGADGDDVLDGGDGDDSMSGGTGNDTYYVDSIADRVTEASASGNDRVVSTISYILGTDVEELELVGWSNLDAAGNAQANIIIGNQGNNNIDGRAGADLMMGDDGNDTYTVDDVGDIVVESPGAGLDTVRSSVTFTLDIAIENLTLLGTANINATGNELDNHIVGNAGNNIIIGGLGTDQLRGEAGADVFKFVSMGDFVGGYDLIEDFNGASGDRLDLSAIDANDLVAGDQAFALIGTQNFTAAGQIRYWTSGADIYVELNTDADNQAEATFRMQNMSQLQDAWIQP